MSYAVRCRSGRARLKCAAISRLTNIRISCSYDLPPNAQNEEVLRVVFREKFTEDLTERLFSDIIDITETLMKGEKENSSHEHVVSHAKGQTMHEKLAASHGEGTRPVSTASRVCRLRRVEICWRP